MKNDDTLIVLVKHPIIFLRDKPTLVILGPQLNKARSKPP